MLHSQRPHVLYRSKLWHSNELHSTLRDATPEKGVFCKICSPALVPKIISWHCTCSLASATVPAKIFHNPTIYDSCFSNGATSKKKSAAGCRPCEHECELGSACILHIIKTGDFGVTFESYCSGRLRLSRRNVAKTNQDISSSPMRFDCL